MTQSPNDPPSHGDDGGPYRSRLLSFLRRQVLRWRDRSQTIARQASSAGVWGLQLLLYPVYAFFRGGRQGLGSSPAAAPARSLAATEMEPAMVEAVAIVATGLAEKLPPATKIDAIASDRESRQPVAIAADGQVLVLPQALQQELQAALAKLQPQQKGWLTRFVDWMGSGPLARSLDFFGESSSVLQTRRSATAERSLVHLWALPTPEEPFSLQVLLQSAISYFFGPRATQRLETAARDRQQAELETELEVTPVPEPSAFAPWLAYEDLFPASLTPATAAETDLTELPNAEETSTRTTAVSEGLELEGTDLFVSALPPRQEFALSPTQIAEGVESPTVASSSVAETLVPAPPEETEASLDDLDLATVERAADESAEYLNVRAVTSGYAKHPLEAIVGWLDRILSWAETRVATIWQLLRVWVASLFGRDR